MHRNNLAAVVLTFDVRASGYGYLGRYLFTVGRNNPRQISFIGAISVRRLRRHSAGSVRNHAPRIRALISSRAAFTSVLAYVS